MRLFLSFLSTLLLLCFTSSLYGQMSSTSGPPYTPESLIETVFLGDGVEVISVQYEGDVSAVGFFDGGGPFVGMNSGVIMTTGSANNASMIGSQFSGEALNNDAPANGDLQALVANPSININDEVRYTITFVPFSDTLRFRFSFASEEYPEYVCHEFNDVFGFFISGPGISGPFSDNSENIALIPGTNFPVAISYVNPGVSDPGGNPVNCMAPNGSLNFSQFYVDNDNSPNAPVYDGRTVVFTAEAIVVPCEEYVIKLAIADGGDSAFDSGVFLEAKSFGGTDFDLTLTDISLDGTLAEGCRPAFLNFEVDQPSGLDRVIPVEFLGTATPGVDYNTPPDSIFIPAGDTLSTFTLQAFEDNIVEGIEIIQIIFQKNLCQVDTLIVRITDNLLVPGMLPDTVIVCPGDTLSLDATLPVLQPDPPRFESNGTVTIGIPPAEYSSFININNILPEVLQAGVIKNVCIDSLTHQWISDLDLYLVGPNGQVLELSTDNGADGGNSFGEDAYIGTCFTPNATQRINDPGPNAPADSVPFTGNYLPEGTWSDIYNGNFSTNGNWELRIIDDSNFGAGRLWKWSICLEPIYEINYEWSPGNGISCTDCPITDYLGDGETTYFVTATDSYGCTLEDSVTTMYEPTPVMDQPNCGELTDSSIQVNWTSVAGASSYEIRLDQRDFNNVGSDLSYTFNGLLPSTDYTFFVRAIFDPCPSPQVSLTCTTAPCVVPNLQSLATDLSCFEAADGTIASSTIGGRAPYIYTINGLAVTGGDTTMLPAGQYEVIVSDTVACADTVLLTISQPDAISPLVQEFQSVTCNGNQDAILVATVNGGTPPYSYRWNGAVGTDTLAGQGPGNYLLNITDGNGCTDSTQLTITEPDLLAGAVVGTTTQNCIGSADGTASVNVMGGTLPYAYSWSIATIGNIPNPTGLSAGDYTVTVTDASGCAFELSMTVGLEPAVAASGMTTDILCNGAATGVISTSVSVGQSPFTHDWTGPNNPSGGASISDLVAGDYSVVVTDNRGCLDTLSFTLSQPDTILGSAQVTTVNCSDTNSGAIDWSGFGGVQPYNFSWSNGMVTEDLVNISTGNYQLEITDANGCVIEQDYFVDFAPAIVLETIIDSVSCFGEADGNIFGRLENAAPPYSLNWVRNGSQDSIAGLNLTNVVAGTYNLIGMDAFGCPINTTLTIPQPAQLELATVKEDIRCAGEINGLIELNATGGTPTYQYQLDNGPWQTNGIFIGLEAGRHNAALRDDNGCLVEVPAIEIIEPDPLELELGEDITIRWGDSIELLPLIEGGSGVIASYQWIAFDSTVLNCFDCAVVFAKPADQITIRLRITDDFGCSQEDFITIFINKDFPVEVPTGFTPNDDGVNDRLIVHGIPGTEVVSFQVFNRWGGLVYEAESFLVNDANSGWDGKFKEETASGTFVWQLTARLPDGSEKSFHGQTTLLR